MYHNISDLSTQSQSLRWSCRRTPGLYSSARIAGEFGYVEPFKTLLPGIVGPMETPFRFTNGLRPSNRKRRRTVGKTSDLFKTSPDNRSRPESMLSPKSGNRPGYRMSLANDKTYVNR